MDRRTFMQSALLAGPVLGGTLPSALSGSDDPGAARRQQWYELRTYSFASEGQRQLTGAYLEQAYLPALNRAGSGHVGVFSEWQMQEAQPQGIAKTFLLIPFESIASFAALHGKLQHDAAYLHAGEPYLAALATNPAYERIESSLMIAFAHMPVLEAPERKDRLFELRCYESPSESAGQKKIEMFNEAGEIDIFRKVGARPVFFGETIIGPRRPNLTYMLCFDNMAAHDVCWKAFGSDPDWKRVSALPEYSDAKLISKITRTFLAPLPSSRI